MFVHKETVNDVIETNTYFYIDEVSKHGWLIDAGAQPEKLLELIKQHDWQIEAILLTHGHFDHIGAVEKISKTLNIPYKIHKAGKLLLEDAGFNLSQYCGRNIILKKAEYFADGEEICLSENPQAKLRVIHTPGHTPDSVVFYDAVNNVAFVGDTIFKNSVGNTAFPGGNENILWQSIKNKIFTLPDKTLLYSGHSEETTVAEEKQRYM